MRANDPAEMRRWQAREAALTHHIAIKPVQVEYFRTQFNSHELGGPTSSFGDHQNGIRYSAGVVFQFGGK